MFLWVVSLVFAGWLAPAVTISSSAVEVEYEFAAEFRSLHTIDEEWSAEFDAQFHASHLFGLFHSNEYATQYGYDEIMIEGFAGSKAPEILSAKYVLKPGDDHLWVKYRARGQMLVLRKVADAWFKNRSQATVRFPLLRDLNVIYTSDRRGYTSEEWLPCTDWYYQGPVDFYYFYNPFRCSQLSRPPLAQDVELELRRLSDGRSEKRLFPHAQLRSGNENGKLTTLYFAYGFDRTPPPGSSPQKVRSDRSYRVFAALGRMLVEDFGFEAVDGVARLREVLGEDMRYLQLLTPVWQDHYANRTFFRTYVRREADRVYVARAALLRVDEVDSRGRPLKSFPKFWKEAWENGDVLYYGGHSGNGVNLDVETVDEQLRDFVPAPLLEELEDEDLGAIAYSPSKTQLAFIDACSSYDLYRDMYLERKPEGLHLMTNGVVSLFHNAVTTVEQLLRLVLTPAGAGLTWKDALASIEENQLNSHVDFHYDNPAVRTRMRNQYRTRGQFPSYLLNVWAP